MRSNTAAVVQKRIKDFWQDTDLEATLFKSLTSLAVIAVDFDGNIIAYNEGARRVYGYTPQQVIGKKTIDIFFPHEFRENDRFSGITMNLLKKENISYVYKMRRKSGEIFPARLHFVVIKKQNGDIIGFVNLTEDLTKRKKTEKTIIDCDKKERDLRESEARFRQIAENMHEMIYLVDPRAHRLLYVNPAYEGIFGRPLKSLQKNPRSWLKAVYSEDKEKIIKLIKNYDGNKISDEFRIIKPDGQISWIHSNIIPIKDSSGQVYRLVGVISDITKRKKYEEEIKSKRRQLLEQNKANLNFLNLLEVSASSLNFNASLNKILPIVNRLSGGNVIIVYFIDYEKETAFQSHQWGLSKEELPYYLSLGQSFTKKEFLLLFDQKNKFVGDITEIKAILPPIFAAFLKRLKIKSLQIMPLVCNQQIVAQFIFLSRPSKVFSKKDEEIAGKIRRHLESSFLADKNAATLLTESMNLARQLEITEAMGGIDREILHSTSKEGIIFGSINLLGKVVAGDYVEVLEFDSEKKAFILAAMREQEKTESGAEAVFYYDDIQSWSSIMFGIPIYFADFSREPPRGDYEKRFFTKKYNSLLIMPLLSKGELIGILSIANKGKAPLNPAILSVVRRLADQIAVALSNAGLIEELKELLVGVVNSFAAALDAKSPWTKGHSTRVSDTAVRLGKALGLNDDYLYKLRLAALFHDMGKIGTFDIVLNKKNKLNKEELNIIKRHPVKTYEILSPIAKLKDVATYAKHHHECWNGTGYPDGLAGEDIPYLSRIISIADTFDAINSDRPYRKALTVDTAIKEFASLSVSSLIRK